MILVIPYIDVTIYRDIAGRRVNDPDYDPHTLLVPADYFKSQTPGHKQWWKEKSKHFDAVIFFKVLYNGVHYAVLLITPPNY